MKTNPRIGIVMETWERESFLPGDLQEELGELSTDIREVDPSVLKGEGAWEKWLEANRPEILISSWMTPRLPEDLRERVPELGYVCHLTGSVKGLVPDSLIEEGLQVTNWGNSISRTVAECGLMLAIGTLRRASRWTVEMHFHNGWKERKAEQFGSLFERRVGLHGFGAISRELCQLLAPFKVSITTYSPSVPDALLEEYGVKRAPDLETLFSENDVIFELAALTPKNVGIVTEELLRSIPQGGVFVNIGRGAVVDEAALARVARDGHIQVGLDVYTTEPLPADSPLRGMTQVLMLPHLGGPTVDRRRDATRLGIDNIRRYLAGEELESRITVDVYKRST